MRFVASTLVFAAALFFGVCGAWVWVYFTAPAIDMSIFALLEDVKIKTDCKFGEAERVATTLPEGIRVIYSGTGKDLDLNDTYLSFLIQNNTRETQSDSALWSTSPFPILTADGKEIHSRRCCPEGDWISVPPVSSVEVRVYPSDFLTRPTRNARISAGFRLGPVFTKTSSIYYSRAFPLPEEFRKRIERR